MLAAMKQAGEINEGRPKKTVGPPRQFLSDLKIDRDLSARAQRIAKVPEDKFEASAGRSASGPKPPLPSSLPTRNKGFYAHQRASQTKSGDHLNLT